MPALLVLGLALDLAGLVGLNLAFQGVLDRAWDPVLAGLLPAVASAVSALGVWRARDRARPASLIAFALAVTGWLVAARMLWQQHYDPAMTPLGLALVAQAIGWCGLVATGAPRRLWRWLVGFLAAALAIAAHIAIPIEAYLEAFAGSVADTVLLSDVETPEQLALHRASVHELAIETATRVTAMSLVVGALALALLLVLWRRPRQAASS